MEDNKNIELNDEMMDNAAGGEGQDRYRTENGKKAFTGNPVSAVYTVPKGKVTAYSKLLKNGGINSKAKVTESK